MTAVSQSIPTLLGGVSQQPDPIKLPGQVREATNVYLDPTFGCVKRPPTTLIKEAATNIPRDAKWFPIFRDQNERYLAVIYDNAGTTAIRVFEADSGIERTVTLLEDSANYINVAPDDLRFLTLNDYTLVCNTKKTVSMSKSSTEEAVEEALVVINQVGYNTTYSVDFLKDGQTTTQEKVYRAAEISVSPGTFEVNDGNGACPLVGSADFLENGSGGRANLGFNLLVNCTPVQQTSYQKGTLFPTGVKLNTTDYWAFSNWFRARLKVTEGLVEGAYVYTDVSSNTPAGVINIRVEAIVTGRRDSANARSVAYSSAAVTSYTTSGSKPWSTYAFNSSASWNGFSGTVQFQVSGLDRGPSTPVYSYKSSYTASVTLQNGGTGWKAGDSVVVSLNGKSYRVKVTRHVIGYNYASENQVTYTTPTDQTAGVLDIGLITGSLTTSINGLADYTATPVGNVIHIKRTDGRAFNIQARGGSTDNAMYAIKTAVNDISLLPKQGVNGMILQVRNSAESEADDYYVRFKTSTGDIPGQGSWEETVKPGITTEFNEDTLPHALIRNSDGSFTFRPLSADYDEVVSWAAREVGDEDTNPEPSFVGQTISGMTFHMNRLVFLSRDTVIMSQPGDYFNFWQGSAIAIADSDPIDMAATSTRPATLRSAVSSTKGLLLFSSDAQFLMSTKDVAFGPSTVTMEEISNYSNVTTLDPLEVGTSVFFNSDSIDFSRVFEMAVDSVDNRPQIAENTRTIPEYIPSGLKWGAASANNNLVIFGDNTSNCYTFKFWNQGNERSLAGWTKWEFSGEIHLISFYDDTGYIVSYNETRSSWVFSRMTLLDNPTSTTITFDSRRFEPRLDNYVPKDDIPSIVVDGNDSKLYLPAGMYNGEESACIQFNKADATYYIAPPIESDGDGEFIRVNTIDLNDFDAYNVGILYRMYVELPQIYVKREKNVDRVNVPVVTIINLELYLSGNYDVTLKRLGYPDTTQLLEAKQTDVYLLGDTAMINTETRPISTYCRGDQAYVTISSEDPLPGGITGYSWDGHYNNRGINKIA